MILLFSIFTMKLLIACMLLLSPVAAFFLPDHQSCKASSSLVLKGYLDALGAIPPPEEEKIDDSREATMMAKDAIDRAGPSDWSQFVDFK
jgi:hypothetical protein